MGQPHAARMALPRAGGAPCPPQASAGLQSGGSPRSEPRAPSLSPRLQLLVGELLQGWGVMSPSGWGGLNGWLEGHPPVPSLYDPEWTARGLSWLDARAAGQTVHRHPCLSFLAPRARSPSPTASPWKASLAVGQREACILRACWTQLPSRLTQAVPARGKSLTVWPGLPEPVWVSGGGRWSECLCASRVSGPIRGASLYLLALGRVQRARGTQPPSQTLLESRAVW